MTGEGPAVECRTAEPRDPPALSLLLGRGAMVPSVSGAAAAWLLDPGWAALGIIWGGATLAFFSGVRRGVSFRAHGGPAATQIATMLWLFPLGLGASGAPWPVASWFCCS